MKKTIDNGHASRAPVGQLRTAKGKSWYLPHFHVYHPRKPNQIRVVFACSAVYENESLNKHLLQGPDELNSLIGVLTRFRKEKVALTLSAYIEQMLHSFYGVSTLPMVRKQRIAQNVATYPGPLLWRWR